MDEWTWIKGKHAVVLGASGRIGAELCKKLVDNCRKLTIISQNTNNRLQRLRDELESLGSFTTINMVVMDVMDTRKIKTLIDDFYEKHDQVDIFIYCVGGSNVFEKLENIPPEEIQRIININTTAPILWLNCLFPYMVNNIIKSDEKKKGHVILLSSRSGERASPMLSVYSAAKGAIELFADALRKEYAKEDIVFTLISPGGIKAPYFSENWSLERKNLYDKVSLEVDEAIKPIIAALEWEFATNKISYESLEQWHYEQGIL
jgi:short-subunit dehydrogenase